MNKKIVSILAGVMAGIMIVSLLLGMVGNLFA